MSFHDLSVMFFSSAAVLLSGADDAVYENIQICNQDDDGDWDSSDFESFEDTEPFNDEER